VSRDRYVQKSVGSKHRLFGDGPKTVKVLVFALAAFASLFAGVAGIGQSFDETMQTIRDNIRNRPASGKVIVIEIDAKSIAQLKSWPWPRRYHAQLVDALANLGVSTIAFDVDFSAPSNLADDMAFAEALKRFGGGAILATFSQRESSQGSSKIENLPISMFRDNAILASVNVLPDEDGVMRHYDYGSVTAATPRPSIAAMVANHQGSINQSFRIDTSIDPNSIPTFSFVDVITGKVPRGQLVGKSVIVGATAIELGDRYVVARGGIIPGVFVQALAAETLIGDTASCRFCA
jgi:diguanylate cyclase